MEILCIHRVNMINSTMFKSDALQSPIYFLISSGEFVICTDWIGYPVGMNITSGSAGKDSATLSLVKWQLCSCVCHVPGKPWWYLSFHTCVNGSSHDFSEWTAVVRLVAPTRPTPDRSPAVTLYKPRMCSQPRAVWAAWVVRRVSEK